jgi:hypothetical protein
MLHCGAPAFFMPLHSLTGQMGQPFASRRGVTHTSGTGISCQWCLATLVTPSWSLISSHDKSSLLAVLVTTLATGCYSCPSCPVPFWLKATDYGDIPLESRKAQPVTGGGGVDPCGAPAFLTPLHSLTGPVDQLFCFLFRGSGLCPGDAPTLLELGSPVSNVSLQHQDKITGQKQYFCFNILYIIHKYVKVVRQRP